MLNIIEGTLSPPLKAVIYGPEGIGKSTLVSNAPNPLYIDTEDGTSRMNVRRIRPKSWEELIAIIEEVAKTPGLCETLIIDTADWAEMMCIQDICAKYKVSGLESFGYGKGYTSLARRSTMRRFPAKYPWCRRCITSVCYVPVRLSIEADISVRIALNMD